MSEIQVNSKRVVVISRVEDLVADNYSKMKSILQAEENIIKKNPQATSFEILPLVKDTLGILWFISRDYTNLINDIEFIDSYTCNKVFCFDATSFELTKDSPEITKQIEQAKWLREHYNLPNHHIYFKFKLTNATTDKAALISWLSVLSGLVERVQLDLSNNTINDVVKTQLAVMMKSVGAKNKIVINSCRFSQFAKPNMYIGHAPCIDGALMQRILNLSMVQNVDTYVPMGCNCHKHMEILGCGEEYDSTKHTIKASSLKKAQKREEELAKQDDNEIHYVTKTGRAQDAARNFNFVKALSDEDKSSLTAFVSEAKEYQRKK